MMDMLPMPKADELLYSIFARFAWRLDLSNRRDFLQILFGQNTGTAVVDLPTLLDSFQAKVPTSHPLATQDLVHGFTLFPLYAPFMEPRRAGMLLADIKGDGGTRASLRAGLMAHQLVRSGLKACPKCIAEDLACDGEPYWRRAHQAPGVIVCSIHRIFLVQTSIAGGSRQNRQEFLPPPDSIASKAEVELTIERQDHTDFLQIAYYTQAVMAQPDWRVPLTTWAQMYQLGLSDLGYSSAVNVETSRLVCDFNARFTPEFFRQIGCQAPRQNADSWLARLIRHPRVSRPALHHFLLWMFLNWEDDEAVRLSRSPAPIAAARKRMVPPKPSPRSPEWLERLRRLWQDPEHSLRAIAKDLQVDPMTVKRYAVKLELKFPRTSIRPTTTAGVNEMIARRRHRIHLQRRRQETWLKLQSKHPRMGAKGLRRLNPALYAALYRATPTWLREHQPARQACVNIRNTDWATRDGRLHEALKTAFISLVVSPLRPKQITVAALGRKIGSRALLEKHIDKLPNCGQFLHEVVDNRVQFALRRLGYVAAVMQTAGEELIASRILRAAGIRSDLAKNQVVSDCLDNLIHHHPTPPTYTPQFSHTPSLIPKNPGLEQHR